MTDETRLYAVSSGNGNNGVSHIFPDYYVKTNDPYRLAALAMVSSFKPAFKQAAADALEVNGEADFTVSATIYNPEDVDPSEAHDRECDCGAKENDDADEHSEDCAMFVDDDSKYCNANGAWQIVEVFPDDGPNMDDLWHKTIYDSIEDAFPDDDLTIIPSN